MAGRKKFPINQSEEMCMKRAFEVGKWMQNDLNLPQYIDTFIRNGYDDMETIKNTMTAKHLSKIGVKKKKHLKKIMNAIKRLKRESFSLIKINRAPISLRVPRKSVKLEEELARNVEEVRKSRADFKQQGQSVTLNNMILRASESVKRCPSMRFRGVKFGSKKMQQSAINSEIKKRTVQMYEALWRKSREDVEEWKEKWYDLYQKYNEELKKQELENNPNAIPVLNTKPTSTYIRAKELSTIQRSAIDAIMSKYDNPSTVRRVSAARNY